MILKVEDYIELERLGLDCPEANKTSLDCTNIRELEYVLYFSNYDKR